VAGMEWVIRLIIHAWRGSTVAVHDRWDGIGAPLLARLDGLMIEPKGRGAMC